MTRTGDARDTAGLLEQTTDAARAWVRGDVERYLELTHHAPGFTLAARTGGPPEQFADRPAGSECWSSPFSEGDAALEITATHVWDDTVVLVMIERQSCTGTPIRSCGRCRSSSSAPCWAEGDSPTAALACRERALVVRRFAA